MEAVGRNVHVYGALLSNRAFMLYQPTVPSLTVEFAGENAPGCSLSWAETEAQTCEMISSKIHKIYSLNVYLSALRENGNTSHKLGESYLQQI